MKSLKSYLFLSAFVLILLLFTRCKVAKTKDFNSKPNILFVMIDDLGWSSLSCLGNERVQTVNIDKLAEKGILFTQAYATPQCTPTRASLLTGQHTARNKMWHVIPEYGYPYARMQEPDYQVDLPRETYTLGKAMKDNGYTTACLGKWHLSSTNNDGYYTYLYDSAKANYGFDYVNPVTDPPEYHHYGDKGVDFLTDQAIQFMEKNKDTSFFIYLSHHTIHSPILAPCELVQKNLDKGYPERGQNFAEYHASIEHFDNSVGRLTAKLEELGLTEKTMVVFYSDNGGVDREFDQALLRSGKGSAYEGGIRVPLIVSWPGHIKPGQKSNELVQVIDFYPTLVDYAGGKLMQDHILDGGSIRPLLEGGTTLKRDELYWYMPLYDPQWGACPSAVIRKGDYKLIWFFGDYIDVEDNLKYIPEGRVELYNLAEDISESNDLAEKLPEKKAELKKNLSQWMKDMGEGPTPLNPDYNANDPLKLVRKVEW